MLRNTWNSAPSRPVNAAFNEAAALMLRNTLKRTIKDLAEKELQ